MLIEFSILLLLLVNCDAISNSNNQDRKKHSSDQLMKPYWPAIQRNRKVIHQPYVRSWMFLDSFTNPTRPLFLQSKYSYHYNFDD